jgi:predicted transposase YdaD
MLKEAKHALEKLSADPEARLQAEHRETSLLLYEAGQAKIRREGREEGRVEGREEGRVEGREEGRVEGKAAVLLELLALKFGQLSPEVVQRVQTAPEASLDSWLKRLMSATKLDDVLAQPQP